MFIEDHFGSKKFNINFSHEYFLSDHIYKLGNFNTDYITSNFVTEGYVDFMNCDAETLQTEDGAPYVTARQRTRVKKGEKSRYDFAFIPDLAFLANADPLLKNCELKLRFDRADKAVSLLRLEAGGTLDDIIIEDCYAVTEYISSPELRSHFDKIEYEPILYKYEDVEVLVKSIPYDQKNIRFDNLRGGNTPSHIFAGIIRTKALDGDETLCSTKFGSYGIEEMNFTLNGTSVNGYPISVRDASPVFPLQKFIDATNRTSNISCGKFLTPNEFIFNWLWAHNFEAEQTSQGWTGINLKLKEPYTTDDGSMSLVVWIISPAAIKIDKFHQVEKLNL